MYPKVRVIFPMVLLGSLLSPTEAKDCSFAVELLQLQDASGSFQAYVEVMRKITMDLIEVLSEKYEAFQIGLAGFVDKPLPFRGIGNFGANTFTADWCYRLFSPMTSNATQMETALGDLIWNMGVGGDMPENPLEALIFGAMDSAVGWTDPYSKRASTENTVRIMLLVTDDKAHQPTEADDGTARGWNWPRSYPHGPSGSSEGGFGAHNFITSNLFAEPDKYARMADLFRLYDNNLTMTPDEHEELLTLIDYYGPYPWPKVQPHPGDNSQPACELTEYPSIEQVAYVLQVENVLPIFLVPQEKPDLIDYYTSLAHQLGVLSVVAPMDLDTIFENIVDAVTTMTQAVCEAPTTTWHPRPPTTTTTPHPPLTNPPIIIPTRATSTSQPKLSTIPDEPTKGPTELVDISTLEELHSENQHASVTDSISNNIASEPALPSAWYTSPTETVNVETSEETTAKEEGGAATGVIIGATTGAIVGVGAVAGGVYAALGTNFLSNPAPMENIDTNVGDAPTEAVERERLEQVTMDMFH